LGYNRTGMAGSVACSFIPLLTGCSAWFSFR